VFQSICQAAETSIVTTRDLTAARAVGRGSTLMSGTPMRRRRGFTLLVLLAALLAPLASVASGNPCCAGMASPCHRDPAPCATLDAAPCCDVAPAAAWPTAERECGHSLQAASARAPHVAIAQIAPPAAVSAVSAQAALPLRLSVVLRN
jgi:hypothetical protein